MAWLWRKIRSADILPNAVLSGHVGSGAVLTTSLKAFYGTNYSCAGLSVTINHNLGVVPNLIVLTPATDGADIRRGTVNASQITINVDVSGATFDLLVAY
jgi:hypothetical protein